jgi:hypothetical protein
MKSGIAIIVSLTLSCCTSDNISPLSGRWVDINTKTDTLTFGSVGGQEHMVLGRGKEVRDGFSLPKYGSGPYQYELLQGDTISLRWSLSSNSNFHTYYFKQIGHQLSIGDFFDTRTSGSILTFAKID